MRKPIYRSVSSMCKEARGVINVSKGRYMCKIVRKDIPSPFSIAANRKTLLEVIDLALSGPVVLSKELHVVEYIDIKNFG